MQFYASTEYLSIAAQAYFSGRKTTIELVKIDNQVFRLLVVDGKKVVSELNFIDYLEPLENINLSPSMRQAHYAPCVVHEVIEASQWERNKSQEQQPAPFIDWSTFTTFTDYEDLLKTRSKRLYKEQQRRRRRLAEQFGELTFQMHDTGDDVLELAFKWKIQQFHNTGVPNYLADSRNRRHFELLRDNDLLTVSTLRGDERLLSVWLGFVHEGVWSGWIFAYDKDPSLQKYSLGHQLLHSMLKESKQLGHREFDFSIGDEDYKWFYSSHVRVLESIGRPPFAIQIGSKINQAKDCVKASLNKYPYLLEGVTSFASTMRGKKNRMIEQLQRLRGGVHYEDER